MQMNRLFQIVYYLLESGKSSSPELAKNSRFLLGLFTEI